MTPFAAEFLRQSMGKGKGPILSDPSKIVDDLVDAHCFEITDAFGLARSLARTQPVMLHEPETLFLPSPKTWFEYRISERQATVGLLLKETDVGIEWFPAFTIGKSQTPEFVGCPGRGGVMRKALPPTEAEAFISAILMLINTPKIVGRTQHMPHRGLEREFLRSRKRAGSFPLRAWTEIKLKIGPTHDAAEHPSIEAHYTGNRPFHFCRAHLRVRFGRLEVVKSHWRGDPSLGIKRSRYKAEPAQQGGIAHG